MSMRSRSASPRARFASLPFPSFPALFRPISALTLGVPFSLGLIGSHLGGSSVSVGCFRPSLGSLRPLPKCADLSRVGEFYGFERRLKDFNSRRLKDFNSARHVR
jgi:hypothetical protein